MISEHFPALIVVTPLILSFFIPIVGWWRKSLCLPIVLTALSVCMVSAIGMLQIVIKHGKIHYWLGKWQPPWGIEYVVDHLNAYVLIIVSFMAIAAAIYSKRNVEKEIPEHKIPQFYTLFLLNITGLLGITITGDAFNLYVLLEIASFTAYGLVAIGTEGALVASFRYIVMGTIGACFYLLGVGYLYIVTGSLNMENLRILLPPLYGNSAVQTAFIFILVGLGIKVALFPLHAWQPGAYTYAPSTVTILISTAMAKTGAYAFIRLLFSVFTVDFVRLYMPMTDIICWLSAIAMIVGSIYAIVQTNLKRMLAYSSIANVGYIMLGVGLAFSTKLGLTPALMHILNHALIKGAMFMAACAFIHKAGLWDIRDFTGLGRRMPYTSFVFILSALAMIGMPPSVGFITKLYLILAAIDARQYVFVAVIFISTLLMIIYFWRVIEIMYLRPMEESKSKGSEIRVEEIPMNMLLPGLVLAFLCFIIGIAWLSGIFSPVMEGVNRTFGLGRI
ncbi:MAG: monovalent cation/H+ antiporter subunit D family protein [Thermodesulfovibrionales bacterium]